MVTLSQQCKEIWHKDNFYIPSLQWTLKLSCVHACMLRHFNFVWCCMTPWTVARQAPLSVGFSRQESWSRLPFPSPGDLPWPRDQTRISCGSCIAGGFFTIEPAVKLPSYYELTQLEKLDSQGILTGVRILRTHSPLWLHQKYTVREMRGEGLSSQKRWANGPESNGISGKLEQPRGLGVTARCAGFTSKFPSLQGLRLFCLTRFTDSSWEKVKSSALNNLKERVFCIHFFPVQCEKKISETWQNGMGLN